MGHGFNCPTNTFFFLLSIIVGQKYYFKTQNFRTEGWWGMVRDGEGWNLELRIEDWGLRDCEVQWGAVRCMRCTHTHTHTHRHTDRWPDGQVVSVIVHTRTRTSFPLPWSNSSDRHRQRGNSFCGDNNRARIHHPQWQYFTFSAKYKIQLILSRKIQHKMLHKIQIF